MGKNYPVQKGSNKWGKFMVTGKTARIWGNYPVSKGSKKWGKFKMPGKTARIWEKITRTKRE
jgi:hypothetical protein